MVDMIIFIYGISVMFVDVITSDAPIIIDNDVMEITNFSTQRYVWILPFTCYKLHAPLPTLRAY